MYQQKNTTVVGSSSILSCLHLPVKICDSMKGLLFLDRSFKHKKASKGKAKTVLKKYALLLVMLE